jgi:hypothetical protein
VSIAQRGEVDGMELRRRDFWLIAVLISILTQLPPASVVFAQYGNHSGELPGTTIDAGELLTFGLIAASGTVVGRLAVPMPAKKEVDFRKLRPEEAVRRTIGLGGPVLLRVTRPSEKLYGLVRNGDNGELVLDSETGRSVIAPGRVKLAGDLETEAARQRATRLRTGYSLLGFVAASLYGASTEHGVFGGGSRAVWWLQATLYTGGAVWFFKKSTRAEVEAAKWSEIISGANPVPGTDEP